MNDGNETIESLVKGGLIGAVLGAVLSKDKEEGAVIGALLGAAISATLKANKEAKKTNVPMYIEEDGNLYELSSFNEKRFVRKLKKPTLSLPEKFQLR